MGHPTFRKLFSTGVSLLLVASSISLPVHSVGLETSFIEKYTPPSHLGFVSSSFVSHAKSAAPRLILISDLHAQVEVQHNIVGILHDLLSKISLPAGRKLPIFVEGGYEPHLEEPLRRVTSPDARTFLNEYFLQKSQIGAAQSFSEDMAGTGQVELTGVENKAEYEANRRRFISTYPVRKKILYAFARQEKNFRQLSHSLSNASFEKLQSLREDYRTGRIGTTSYAKTLVREADHFHITGSAVETLRHLEHAQAESWDVAFAQVYGAVALRLCAKAPWMSHLRPSLGDEQTMRENIARFDSDFDLLKRLVANQLVPSEVPFALARMPYLTHLAESLVGDDEVGTSVKGAVEKSIDFYPYAFLRDKILVENSLKVLEAGGDKDVTGILVVGGFHVQAIETYLQAHDVSYLHINPVVTRDLTTDEEINYARRMAREPISPAELQADLLELNRARHLNADSPSYSKTISNTAPPAEPDAMGAGALADLLQGKDLQTQLAELRVQGLTRALDPTLRNDESISAKTVNPLGNLIYRNRENFPGLAKLRVFLDQSFKLTRSETETQGLFYSVNVMENGELTPSMKSFEEMINTYFLPYARNNKEAPQSIYVFVVPDENAIDMGAEGLHFHGYEPTMRAVRQGEGIITFNPEKATKWGDPHSPRIESYRKSLDKDEPVRMSVIILTESRTQNPGPKDFVAQMQTYTTQGHEVAHAFMGRRESSAFLYGILLASQRAIGDFAGNFSAHELVMCLLDSMRPQMMLYEKKYAKFAAYFTDAQFRSDLAEAIASLLQGPPITERDIKAMADRLRIKYPELPAYLIAQTLDETVAGDISRLGGNGDSEEVQKEAEAVVEEKLKPKAKSLLGTLISA